MKEQRSHIYGVMGEFETPGQLCKAARKVRDAGYSAVDAYAPFPVEGLSEALGLPTDFRNYVALLTLLGGLLGGCGGFGLQYWVSAIAYPMNIGGRPLNSWPAFIPVTFELTILGAATFAVIGMIALNKLPEPYHPVFNVERFAHHASTDRFFLCIEACDPKFDAAEAARFLREIKAENVTEVEDD